MDSESSDQLKNYKLYFLTNIEYIAVISLVFGVQFGFIALKPDEFLSHFGYLHTSSENFPEQQFAEYGSVLSKQFSGKIKVASGNISGFLHLRNLIGDRVDFRIRIHPKFFNFFRAFVGKPRCFSNRNKASSFQEFPPFRSGHAHKTNVGKWHLPTKSGLILLPEKKGCHIEPTMPSTPILKVQLRSILVEPVDEIREQVDPGNLSGSMLG